MPTPKGDLSQAQLNIYSCNAGRRFGYGDVAGNFRKYTQFSNIRASTMSVNFTKAGTPFNYLGSWIELEINPYQNNLFFGP